MPFIDIIFRNKISDLGFESVVFKNRIKKYAGKELNVKEFSIRHIECHPLDEIAADIEIRILADVEVGLRKEQRDKIGKRIENSLLSHPQYFNKIRVFLFLDYVGFNQKKG